MSLTKQILLAFLIPFTLAVTLFFLGDYIFPLDCTSWSNFQGKLICFDEYQTPYESLVETFYLWLTIALFIMSLILPAFLTRRSYQSKVAEIKLKSKSIIE